MKSLNESIIKSVRGLWNSFPIIFGTMLLVSLISVLFPESFYTNLFSKNIFFDSFIGSLIGSISTGNPVVSYIFSGELLDKGIGLLAVTSFLVSWVTVGLIQIPAESAILGKKFALLRNLISFIFSIIVSIITIIILGVF